MSKLSKHTEKTAKIAKKVGEHASHLQQTSTKQVNKYVLRRKDKIAGAKRFVASWMLLALLICIGTAGSFIYVQKAASTAKPISGGTYTEGMIGEITNLNPLFASGGLDDSTSRLLFNGLLRYNTNGDLVPDLAKEWKANDDRKSYTVILRDDVLWHDGRPFTADDVVYTIGAIQNPATRSTQFASWQGVTAKAVNKHEVKFELPAPFAPFPGALTVSILPKHILGDTQPAMLRSSPFNTQPIGTGPFTFSALRNDKPKEQQVELARNSNYFKSAPKLERFVIHTYPDDDNLANALEEREITAAVDLKIETAERFNSDKSIRSADIPLNSGVYAFFKNSTAPLTEASVRTALAQAINRQAILMLFKARYAPLKGPLLPYQLGYDSAYSQQTKVAEAEKALDAAGWAKQPDGIRAKDGAKLELGLTTVNSAQYTALASELQKQWKAVGVAIKPQLLTSEQLQQTALSAHSYDILLYGISIGQDPDVYAYWHSSQARTGGLNFSEWKSGRADASLEVARTRLEPVLREARYKTFQDEWLKSSPAVALYQPRLTYSYHQNATGFKAFPSNNASDRLTNVEEWTVGTKDVTNTP